MSTSALDPVPLLDALQRHGVDFIVVGAAAAVTQGSPLPTYDLDITPARDQQNIERIVAALIELDAKLRTPTAAVPFPVDAMILGAAESWTLETSSGPLDLVFVPTGTKGYDDLGRDALRVDLGTGTPVLVASLRDVIRMKEASNRERDRAQLPALRRTLEVLRRREGR